MQHFLIKRTFPLLARDGPRYRGFIVAWVMMMMVRRNILLALFVGMPLVSEALWAGLKPKLTSKASMLREENGVDTDYPWRFDGRLWFRPAFVRAPEELPGDVRALSLLGWTVGGGKNRNAVWVEKIGASNIELLSLAKPGRQKYANLPTHHLLTTPTIPAPKLKHDRPTENPLHTACCVHVHTRK